MAQNSATAFSKGRPFKKSKLDPKKQPVKKHQDSFDLNEEVKDQLQYKREIIKHQTAFGLQKANFGISFQRKKANSNRYYKNEEVSAFVGIEHFKIYGPGIYLFFEFIWKLSLLFFILTIISIVPMTYNYLQGRNYQNSFSSLEVIIGKVSISNFDGDDPSKSQNQLISNTKIPKLVNCVSDLVSSLVVMIFYFYMINSSDKRAKEIKSSLKMPNYFTIELNKFAQDATQMDIYNFFNQFGAVAELAPVKDYSQSIQLSKDIYQNEVEIKELLLEQQQNSDTDKKKQILEKQQKIMILYKELIKQQMKASQQVLKYYVSFSKIQERDNTLQQFDKVYNKYCLFCRYIPQEFLLKGEKVSVKPCHDQPSGIIWQNVHITWKTRWIRALIQFVLLFVFILIGFFFISSLNLVSPPTNSKPFDTSFYTSTTILHETNLKIVQSWCLKNTDKISSNQELSTTCQKYINRYYVNLVITYSITILVIVIKTILKKFVIFLAEFQRHKQVTEQSIDIMKNLVIIYILTTVVIGFLLQAELFGIKFKLIVPQLMRSSFMLQNADLLEDYAELQNNWYLDIGYQIWFTWLILSVTPHSYMPLVFYLMQQINQYFGQKQKTQKSMDKAIESPQFQIEDHYANIIMITLVGFVFSGGMPCMIPITFIAIITRYFYLKFLFIRFSKVPKFIDQHLNEKVLSYLPWILFFHFLMSIWMFSTQSIFAFEQSIFSEWYKQSSYSIIQFTSKLLGRGIASYYYTLGAIIMLVIILIKQIVYDLLISLLRNQGDPVEKLKNQDTKNDLTGTIRSHRNITSSYRIENNPNYFQILSIKQKMKGRILNGEILQNQDQKI